MSARTLAAVDIHADVTSKHRACSGNAQSCGRMWSNWPSDFRLHYYLGSYRLNTYAQNLGTSLSRCPKSCTVGSQTIVVHRLIHRKWGSTIRMPWYGTREKTTQFCNASTWMDILQTAREEGTSGALTNVWEEHAPIESDRYGGDLGRTLGFPVQAGPAHHPQRSIP